MTVSSIRFLRYMFIIFYFFAFVAHSVNLQAEDQIATKTVVIIGTGKIQKEDSASARKEAIENSLASAVESVALDLIPLESLPQTFQSFNETFYGQTGKFIHGYKVLAEFQIKDTYRVMVEANVSIASLTKRMSDAGIMSGGKSLPKILVLVSEQNLEDTSPKYWWGKKTVFSEIFSVSAIIETIRSKGIPVLDNTSLAQNTSIDNAYDKPDLDKEEAVNLGLRLKADIVIIGKTMIDQAQNVVGKNIKSFKGVVTARAIRTDKREEIATITQSAVTANADETLGARKALSTAGSLAGETLASQIMDAWQKKDEKTNIIGIVVEGTDNLANFEKFLSIIKKISGVKNLQIKELKANETVISLEFKGNAKTLADALMLKSYESVEINIYEVSKNHMRVALISG
ncbi:MAG: hypothetical protein JRF17_09695 [Deltaproteobacteria bacterium]|nr:hypothetical protein [Deltaproteobacteria bacterium]